jgi:hypothetical protein
MVDRAQSGVWIQKDTISIGVFDQTDTSPNLASKPPLEFFKVVLHAHSVGNRGLFFLGDPNKTGSWTGATATALRAFKRQTACIPGLLVLI